MTTHTLHLGDCLEGMRALPDKSVDVAIFDAPYSEHVHTRSRRGCIEVEPGTGRAAFNRRKDLGFAHLTSDLMEGIAQHVARLTRRWVLAFSDTESAHLWREAFERAGLEYVRTLFWVKVGGTPQFTGDRPGIACEAITLAHPFGRKRWNGGGKQGVYHEPIALDRGGASPRIHPTQKPIGLMRALVSDFTDAGETVLDCVAGGGTTLVACKELGRSAVGFELDPAFHAAAVKRIEAAREQLVFPTGRRSKPKQSALALEEQP
jgi:DNA modification methylase